MQIFTLVTNISRDVVSTEVIEEASNFVSQLFGVSKETVLVNIKADVKMAWGKKPGVYALGTIQNTVPIRAEDTKEFAPAVFEFVEKKFKIPQNRMYLGFITLDSENIAFAGKLYSNLVQQ